MRISLAGIVLCDALAGLPPIDLRLNGVRVVDLSDFARAASKGIFYRGNSANTLSFSVSRVYDSYADAQDAFWLAESVSPTKGPLLVRQTGAAPDRPPIGAANAVLEGVVPDLGGVRVNFAYTIKTGRIVGGSVLPYLTDEGSPTMTDSVPIPQGQNFVAVNFPAPLQNPLVSGCMVQAPTPGIDGPGFWKIEQVTGSESGGNGGFVGYLTGPAPVAGFFLNYTAKGRP